MRSAVGVNVSALSPSRIGKRIPEGRSGTIERIVEGLNGKGGDGVKQAQETLDRSLPLASLLAFFL